MTKQLISIDWRFVHNIKILFQVVDIACVHHWAFLNCSILNTTFIDFIDQYEKSSEIEGTKNRSLAMVLNQYLPTDILRNRKTIFNGEASRILEMFSGQ